MATLVAHATPFGIKFLNKLTDGNDTWNALLDLNEFIFGANGRDRLTAAGGDDILAGGKGVDTVKGGDGDDLLFGDSGNDTLIGGHGFDQMFGGSGKDKLFSFRPEGPHLLIDVPGDAAFDDGGFLDGGSGDDTLYVDPFFDGSLSADGGSGHDTIDFSSEFNVWRNDPPSTLPFNRLDLETSNGRTALGGTLTVARVENITGSVYEDDFKGDNHVNILKGLSGDDVLEGRGGGDTLNGGSGHDAASYVSAPDGVRVDLERTTQSTLNDHGDFNNDAFHDHLTSIEELRGSRFGDTLRGSDAGGQVLKGNGGPDVLEGRDGGDTLDGGSGFDFASYESSDGRVEVFLPRPGFNSASLNDAAGDTLINIEGLIGSSFDDTLVGNDNRNELRGGSGKDLLSGLGGNDVLKGEAGSDTLFGGLGRDTLIGGANADKFSYTSVAESHGSYFERDVIQDFTHDTAIPVRRADGTLTTLLVGGDKIDLHSIDADTTVAGNQDFTFAVPEVLETGEVHVFQETDAAGRKFSHVMADTNGDHHADFELSVYTTNNTALTAADFIL